MGREEDVYNLLRNPTGRDASVKNPPALTRLEIRYGDLDPYGHVNNAVYLEFFEKVRICYWRVLARMAGIEKLETGDVPGARYVIAETTVRFKAPIFFEDTLHGAARMRTVGSRSYAMEFELRTGDTFEDGTLVAEGSATHVFFDPLENTVQQRPLWFLPTVAKLEGRPQASFSPEDR
jgi:acyl-CoA thioester hydrolase